MVSAKTILLPSLFVAAMASSCEDRSITTEFNILPKGKTAGWLVTDRRNAADIFSISVERMTEITLGKDMQGSIPITELLRRHPETDLFLIRDSQQQYGYTAVDVQTLRAILEEHEADKKCYPQSSLLRDAVPTISASSRSNSPLSLCRNDGQRLHAYINYPADFLTYVSNRGVRAMHAHEAIHIRQMERMGPAVFLEEYRKTPFLYEKEADQNGMLCRMDYAGLAEVFVQRIMVMGEAEATHGEYVARIRHLAALCGANTELSQDERRRQYEDFGILAEKLRELQQRPDYVPLLEKYSEEMLDFQKCFDEASPDTLKTGSRQSNSEMRNLAEKASRGNRRPEPFVAAEESGWRNRSRTGKPAGPQGTLPM